MRKERRIFVFILVILSISLVSGCSMLEDENEDVSWQTIKPEETNYRPLATEDEMIARERTGYYKKIGEGYYEYVKNHPVENRKKGDTSTKGLTGDPVKAFNYSDVQMQDIAKGLMTWPVPGYSRISSPFMKNRLDPVAALLDPLNAKKKDHNGIDIPASKGTPIVAAADGKVLTSGWQSGYGYTITIVHDGDLSTLYGHCSKLISKVGDNVKKGSKIAEIGSTGNSTGPHLHFEVRYIGNPRDPSLYVTP